MKHIYTSKKGQRGFSLVETLVGHTLSLLLITTLLAFIAPSVAALSRVKANTDLQDSSRLGFEQMIEAVSFAGYQGCHPDTTYTSALDPSRSGVSPRLGEWAYDQFGIAGFDADETQRLSESLGSSWRNVRYRYGQHAIGDVLVVQNAGNEALIVEDHRPLQFQIVFRGRKTSQLEPGEIIQLNDCEHTARVQISTLSRPAYSAANDTTTVSYAPVDTINCASPSAAVISLGPDSGSGCSTPGVAPETIFQFRPGTRGHTVKSAAYYIGYDSTSGAPALKRSSFATNAMRIYTETMVEGVENLRLRYGVDTDSDGLPDRDMNAAELTAATATNPDIRWGNVVNVELWMMIRSSEKTADHATHRSIMFPAPAGQVRDCIATLPVTDYEHMQHSYACPFSVNDGKQYERRVVAHVIPLHNTNR